MPKNQFLSQAKKFLIETYGSEKGNVIANSSFERFEDLCKENADEPKAMHSHTHVKIYPCISVLDAQIKHGISREDALTFNFKFIEWRSYRAAKIVAKLMKIPGVYKKMPVLFGNMTKKKFGVKQNFDAVFHEISPKEMRFDMTKCPYSELCAKYRYPEITKAFCRGDDIVYGNMHPRLIWGRTKTIGDGDTVCDFKLTVVK